MTKAKTDKTTLREGLKYILEDKDAHFTANWMIIESILSLIKSYLKPLTDEEIWVVLDRPHPDDIVDAFKENCRNISQVTIQNIIKELEK